jgi:hypothetical protein
MRRFDEADVPVSEKKTGALVDVVEPITMSVVAVALYTRSFAEEYVQFKSVEKLAGQLAPLARQTDWPETVSVFNNIDDPDAEVNAKLVEVVFVPVALVHMRLVKLEGDEPLTVRFWIVALVAKKFVVVALVEVVFAKYPFQRRADDPRFCAASDSGLRFVETPLITARWVVVV